MNKPKDAFMVYYDFHNEILLYPLLVAIILYQYVSRYANSTIKSSNIRKNLILNKVEKHGK